MLPKVPLVILGQPDSHTEIEMLGGQPILIVMNCGNSLSLLSLPWLR